MNRRAFLTQVAAVAAGSLGSGSVAWGRRSKNPPNIILILTDDQGWTSVSYRADPDIPESASDYLETPQMARAARMGMQFTDGYAPNPICSPTRHSLLFGQNAARHMYSKNPDWNSEALNWLTIPKVLKEADSRYRTAHFGKWHVSLLPEEVGFDYTDGPTSNSAGDVVNGAFREKDGVEENLASYNKKHQITPPKLNGRFASLPVYYSDENPKDIFGITRRATSFIREAVADDKPFFAYIAHFATHLDMMSTTETVKYFKNKPKGKKHDNPYYAAMLKDMDTAIGRILDLVNDLHIADNTYIFIMGDNGGVQYFGQTSELADKTNDVVKTHETSVAWRNLPLRDGKHEFYEGGIRVPFLALGPDIEANTVCREPVSGLDFLPTFADLAGHTMNLPDTLDGGSMTTVLRNRGRGSVRRSRDCLIFHQGANRVPISAIRKRNYKLVKHWLADNPGKVRSRLVGKKVLELYDLKKDIGEQNDLSETMPNVTKSLHEELLSFLREVNAETAYTRKGSPYNNMLKKRGLGSSHNILTKPKYESPFHKQR